MRDSAASFAPVVGAGLAGAAGAPGFQEIISDLSAAAGHQSSGESDPFEVIDLICEKRSEAWVHSRVAGFVESREVQATPVLCSIAKARSGLVLTTNYDTAIETAADAIGRAVVSITIDDFDRALQPPGEELRVLHLHGLASRPDSIVLGPDSYERIASDDRVQLLLRTLAVQYRLVFLGHRLDPHEVHLRRDLSWVAANAPGVPAGQHLLIADRPALDDPATAAFKADLDEAPGITAVIAADPSGAFLATRRTASVIGGPALVDLAHEATPITEVEFDAHYVPLPVAETAEISTPTGMGGHLARTWMHGPTLARDLDDRVSHLILVGAGGNGKSEELRQIARRCAGPALVQALRHLDPDPKWTDAGAQFVARMMSARAGRPGSPRLTLTGLRDEAYTFLLDGLDEVPLARRAETLRLIAEVAAEYPQHRIVIGTRPSANTAALDATFESWTLLPDRTWLMQYADQRAVPMADLDAALPDSGDLTDMIQIPLFAAAAVSRVDAGDPLPETALELVMDLADRGITDDLRIGSDPAQVRTWLNRLALCMLLSDTTEIEQSDLAHLGLSQGLSNFPSQDDLALLASRALLTDVEGSISFPVNVIREARAAHALLAAGADGLDLLRRFVLIELPVTDAKAPVRAVRPEWTNTLALLVPLAPLNWCEEIAEFDPVMVARGTPVTADPARREAAIRTIWDHTLRRGVWLESRRGGDGVADVEALRRLLAAGTPPGFAAELFALTSDADRIRRGNAIRVLPATDILDRQLLPRVTTLLGDPDPVVRRMAAVTAMDRGYDLMDELIDQANRDPDELAAQTLSNVAVDLALGRGPDMALEVALERLTRRRAEAVATVARALPRQDLLARLRQPGGFDQTLFSTLVEDLRSRDDATWTAADVAALSDVLGMHPDPTNVHDARRLLRRHPVPALLAWLRHPVEGHAVWELQLLIRELTGVQLSALLRYFNRETSSPLSEILQSTGLSGDELELGPDALAVGTRMITAEIERLERVATMSPEPEEDPEPAPVIVEAAGTIGSEQTEDWRAQLQRWNEIAGTRSQQTTMWEPRVAPMLRAAAEQDEPLDGRDTVELFRLLLHYEDPALEGWLAAHAESSVLLAAVDSEHFTEFELLRLSATLPAPWPDGLAGRVLDALDNGQLRDGLRATAALATATAAGAEPVRAWAAEHSVDWIDPVLVRLGDCDAERRLVERLAQHPLAIRQHPAAADEDWLADLRCTSTVPLLSELVRSALVAGAELSDLEGVRAALTRCAGRSAPAVWDDLISQPDIPAAGFLNYDRRDAIGRLIAISLPTPGPTEPVVVEWCCRVVSPATAV
ncbi:SIR2 family protein [Nocardioides abyssi]|uniref:SIR2 family protein n=1 Tax=Nocardioides abyssi TaxID=3058370 RepID=A0ABT8EQM0_9ACTN|nr:SIR2 family protein [Nocardioides abyssi]MDN4160427.1 SIR2 family protein [Nocardioides abyssi]